jgi:hypothetical protein
MTAQAFPVILREAAGSTLAIRLAPVAFGSLFRYADNESEIRK